MSDKTEYIKCPTFVLQEEDGVVPCEDWRSCEDVDIPLDSDTDEDEDTLEEINRIRMKNRKVAGALLNAIDETTKEGKAAFFLIEEKALIVNWLMDDRTHSYFCKMQDEESLARTFLSQVRASPDV